MKQFRLTKAAWIVAIGLLGGCSATQSAPPPAQAAQQNAHDSLDWAPRAGEDVNASTLNIFGEFDGDRPMSVKQVGQSGFQQH